MTEDERQSLLIANAPATILALQDEIDRWKDCVEKLCEIAGDRLHLNDLMAAGFSVSVVPEEGMG